MCKTKGVRQIHPMNRLIQECLDATGLSDKVYVRVHVGMATCIF